MSTDSEPNTTNFFNKNTNKNAAEKIKVNRRKQKSSEVFVEEILAGNTSSLSKAITLIESTNEKHQQKGNEILKGCLPHTGKSIRIGVTGVPGVGKSTFIESFGKHITALNKKVAVLAVDPSSSIHKGSILGDKTRMELLVQDKNAFIRPSPSGNALGGVTQKTKETLLLCEAAGFEVIIIETVGVGQSETSVHDMVDFFLLLKLSGAGDELQGIKRGIIEMADAIVINKADGDNMKNAKIAKQEFNRALHLYPPKENGWTPKTLLASGLHSDGILEIYNLIINYITENKASGYFTKKRRRQNKNWLLNHINHALQYRFYKGSDTEKLLLEEIEKIENGETTPFEAIGRLIK